MSNPNALSSPEAVKHQSALVYETVASISPDRNPDFTAFEQIKGAELAKLYLQGTADNLKHAFPDEYPVDGDKNPLDTAIANMRYIAGYYVSGENAGEQISASLQPWNTAFEQLTEVTAQS